MIINPTDAELTHATARLIGWHLIKTKPHLPGYWADDAGKTMWAEAGNDAWEPLTRPDHWMMVVEKMVGIGYRFGIENFLFDGKVWEAEFVLYSQNRPGSRRQTAQHTSIGHAVCLASLKAAAASEGLET